MKIFMNVEGKPVLVDPLKDGVGYLVLHYWLLSPAIWNVHTTMQIKDNSLISSSTLKDIFKANTDCKKKDT